MLDQSMEFNRTKHRRGLLPKSKLIMALYRATKPSSAPMMQPQAKPNHTSSLEHKHSQPMVKPAKPPNSNSIPSTTAAGFIMLNQDKVIQPPKPSHPNQHMIMSAKPSLNSGYIIVNQDKVFPAQPEPKLAPLVVPEGKMESFYGRAAEDEAVDAKAARYISSVRERFRLDEGVNWERKMVELQ